jgi:hypothetical protein
MRYQCRKAQGFESLREHIRSSVREVKELVSGTSVAIRKGSNPLVTNFLIMAALGGHFQESAPQK